MLFYGLFFKSLLGLVCGVYDLSGILPSRNLWYDDAYILF